MRLPHRHWSWIIILLLFLCSFTSAQTAPDIQQLDQGKPIERERERIKALAATLAAVKTEDEGGALLLKEPELVTAELWKQLSDLSRPQSGEQAMITHRLALRVAEQSGHKLGIATSLNNVGATYQKRGDLKTALEYFQKSLPLAEEIGEKPLVTMLLGNIADVYRQQGNLVQALQYQQKNLKLNEEWGNKAGKAQAQVIIGRTLREQGNYAQALEILQLSLVTFEALDNKLGIARALSNMGYIYADQGKYALALEANQKSLTFSEIVDDKGMMAFALINIGWVYRMQGKRPESMEHLQRGLKLSEEVNDKGGVARALGQIAINHIVLGDYSEALDHSRRALKLNEELGNKSGLAFGVNQIGNIHTLQGDYAQAMEFLLKGLALREEMGDKSGIATSLHTIARIHNSQGNYAQAVEHSQKALKLREELGQKSLIADSLNVIGVAHFQMKNYSLSLEYIKKSLAIMEELGVKRGIAIGLANIGELYTSQGDQAQALVHYRKALALSETLGDKTMIASLLSSIGHSLFVQGEHPHALDYLSRSLALSENVGEKRQITDNLNKIGLVHEKQGNYVKALESAQRSAVLARQIGGREQLWEALTIAGVSYHKLNQLAQSRQAFEEAIATIESLRSGIGGQESRASFFAAVQRPYELYIDVLMQSHLRDPSEGHDALALRVTERARARSLLEALNEARADIRQGVDPALLQRERTLQQRLNVTGERQTRLLTGKHSEEQVATLKREIDALTAEFRDVQAQIRQLSPRYAALTQPEPLGLPEIQALLDADTLLLEYALGDERSYLWAVTPTSINSFELPKRAEIEKEVRIAVGQLSDGKQWSTSNRVAREYAAVATRLSGMLLDPVAAQIKSKRLLIVGDGALQYLPFGALPSPMSKAQGPTSGGPRARSAIPIRAPLIVDHEIVSLPSASTLAILRRESANRAHSTKSIAVLADPVFERDDERLTANRPAASGSTASATSNINPEKIDSRYLLERAFGVGLQPANGEAEESREILRIPRLPFTRREADAILAIVPAGAGMKALDFRASRETATNPEIGEYRLVHFATHGLLNSEHPELSGIVLSLVNEKGQPVDGFLRLHEIYNLQLSADMVVLSACQTGLGKEIRGEGLVGLTRGFMYAGSPRVVASLWKVADAATAELMKNFYQGMLKENLRPAAALRAAQVEMLKQKRWREPYYWAAFQLHGEWK